MTTKYNELEKNLSTTKQENSELKAEVSELKAKLLEVESEKRGMIQMMSSNMRRCQ